MAQAQTSDNTDSQPPPGVIIPPKEIQESIEKTASYIVRNGVGFEGRLRDSAKDRPALQFIFEDSPFNAYYQWRVLEIKAGKGLPTGRDGESVVNKKKDGPEPPPDFHFSARMPNINAVDLEIVKLTALFVAKNGRSWMTTLSQREARNYQFDFLRPQHSFYQFFSRLSDQYKELLSGDTAEGGKMQEARIKELERNVHDKFQVLERARKRAEWVKYQEAQKVQKAEQSQADDISYRQIDWHDFVVAETITFTEADDQADLPPPTSLNDLQSASLEQKAAMSLAPANMRIEETMPGTEDFYPYQPPSQVPMQMQMPHMLPPQFPYPPPHQSVSPAPFAPSPFAQTPFHRSAQEQEEDARIQERMVERERAEQAQAAARSTGPMRIRNDYVPRAQARRQNAATALCPNCRQQVPYAELEQHMKIEMLDPRWRDQQRISELRSSTTNLNTIDVANNLKRLASARSDVFDPVTGQSISEEEEQRRKRVELGSWDGVSQAPTTASGGGAPGPADVQEQIRQLHQKYANQ